MGEDKGSSPKDESCHKTLSKKEFAGGEEEEKERNPPLTCARAQIFLPLPTQFSGGEKEPLNMEIVLSSLSVLGDHSGEVKRQLINNKDDSSGEASNSGRRFFTLCTP